MAHCTCQTIVSGFVGRNFDLFHDDCNQNVPWEIILLFCDYYGYPLCCISVIKESEFQFPSLPFDPYETKYSSSIEEKVESNKSDYTLYDVLRIKDKLYADTDNLSSIQSIYIDALYSSIIFGHVSCYNQLRPKQNIYPLLNGYSLYSLQQNIIKSES